MKIKALCPYCEKNFTDVVERQDVDPAPGDYTMCFGCGKFSVFEPMGRGGKGLRLRPPSASETYELHHDFDAYRLWMSWRVMTSTEGMTRQ